MLFSSLWSTTCLLISSVLTDHANAKPYVLDHRTNVSYTGITSSKGVESFRGIRYGLDTSGENRFAPPRAFVPPTAITIMLRPSWAKNGSKLPVMVYIYGGALIVGTINERTTAPDGFIHASVAGGEPIIYVGMNYRVNIFGFPASEALRQNNSLNAGLRDQRLALEWIQQNIEVFGEIKTDFNSTAAVAAFAGCNSSDYQSMATIACLRSLSMETLLNHMIYQEVDSADTVNTTTFDELLDLYPASEFQADPSANLSTEFYRCAQIFRDILLVCPTVLFSQAMAKKYNTTNPPSYLYVGNQTIMTSYLDATGQPGLGVIHTSDLAYLFNNIDLYNVTDLDLPDYVFEPTESDYALAKSLPLSWISLGTHGNPSRINGSMPGWTSAWPTTGGEGEIFVIGGGNEGMSKLGSDGVNSGVVGERLVERCGFLGREDVIEQFQF
ncbi:sterol esterase [Botrytis cinerea]